MDRDGRDIWKTWYTKIRLNGKELIDFKTNDMVFGVVDYLVAMTTCLTLYPGDVVWMGTDDPTHSTCLTGDTVEIGIEGIGSLRNLVVAARPALQEAV